MVGVGMKYGQGGGGWVEVDEHDRKGGVVSPVRVLLGHAL